MDRITKKAYAKINLFLDVTSKYPDGYHEVHTVMQSVSLFDEVDIELCSNGIEITCDKESVPTDSKNIVWKAAELFFNEISNVQKTELTLLGLMLFQTAYKRIIIAE